MPTHEAALRATLQRVKLAGQQAARRCVDSLGLAALSAVQAREREELLAAQFALDRKVTAFEAAFSQALDARFEREIGARGTAPKPAETRWDALTLVDDQEVEARLTADRFGTTIQHGCEWELRELDTYMGSLLQLGGADEERNPLRPRILGKCVADGLEAVSDRPELRKVIGNEIARTLAATMPGVYRDIVADLHKAGVQPVSLAVRTVEGPGNELYRNTSGYDTLERPTTITDVLLDSSAGGLSGSGRLAGPHSVAGHGPDGPHSGHGASGAGSLGGTAPGGFRHSSRGRGTPIGHVDAEVMSLLRRLAVVGSAVAEATRSGGTSGLAGLTLPANLIYEHREELRRTATGALDHMVIDVVGSLFEQILADPKVPPQMARQLARLQLPVLRVALGDTTFFSSRRHPVRRFVNRMASLAVAFDDLDAGPGQHFLGLVKDLVQEIVTGDFDQIEVYERELARLEDFVARQAAAEVQEQAPAAPSLLDRKETELVRQQRYMQQLQTALAPVAIDDFLRDFLAQVWSQAIVQAAGRDDGGALAQRFRRAGRELVMSVQPKATPTERKAFLLVLPQLMKDLNEGLALIGWPEGAKKDFLAGLLPLHSHALKAQQPMSTLDYNLLARQLDSVLGAPLPEATGSVPLLTEVVDERSFSDAEARAIGLLSEASVDWDGTVDIDLSSDEPEFADVDIDIDIDGLPPSEPTEPTRGPSLADHVQIGFAYQMHLDGRWQKVKLSYVSPGRTFFLFTCGGKHQRSISMTVRMLRRLCESGRMRAFESAYLLERAQARARRQLAALRPAQGAPVTRH